MASSQQELSTTPQIEAEDSMNSPSQKSILKTDGSIPVQLSHTPTKIPMVTVSSNPRKPLTVSPSKLVVKPQQGQLQRHQLIKPLSSGGPVTVGGTKYQYVRLVSSADLPKQEAVRLTATTAGQQMIITHGTQSSHTLQTINAATHQQQPQTGSTTQRLLLPAGQHQAISIASSQSLSQLKNQLPPGTTLITSAPTAAQSGQQGQVVALLPPGNVIQRQGVAPPQVVRQIQPNQPPPRKTEILVPVTNSEPASMQTTKPKVSQNGDGLVSRQRKPCNCTKSQCLKLYCDCFANGEFCSNCNCNNCANNLDHEEERQRAIKQCLDRNPHAFHPKIGKGNATEIRRHQKGCNCKRSGCLKNYCECYEAKIPCGSMCRCVGCKNYEESPERKTLMHLADAAEVRTIQQTAARNKLSTQFSGMRTGGARVSERDSAHSYLRADVISAITECLIAQCHEAETVRCKDSTTEKLVLEEFGRSLSQIIQASNKSKLS